MPSAFAMLALSAPAVAQGTPPSESISGFERVPPSGLYNVINHAARSCLAAPGNTSAATTYQCIDSYTDQYWYLEPAEDGYYRLRNADKNECLAMPWGGQGEHGTTYRCINSYHDQNWKIEKIDGDSYRLLNRKHDLCLSGGASGYVTQELCVHDHWNQWWDFKLRD
ncbi:hypothetical protein GCM10009634_44690 [Saccharothrix xinjiangensis]